MPGVFSFGRRGAPVLCTTCSILRQKMIELISKKTFTRFPISEENPLHLSESSTLSPKPSVVLFTYADVLQPLSHGKAPRHSPLQTCAHGEALLTRNKSASDHGARQDPKPETNCLRSKQFCSETCWQILPESCCAGWDSMTRHAFLLRRVPLSEVSSIGA